MGRDPIEGKAINCDCIWGVGMKLLINGVLQDDLAKLPYSNYLLRGDGLFETILTIDQKVVAWDRHYARLEKSAKQILITLPARIDIEVGLEKISVSEFKSILESKDRTEAGKTVPAHGLFLEEVRYPYITAERQYFFS